MQAITDQREEQIRADARKRYSETGSFAPNPFGEFTTEWLVWQSEETNTRLKELS